MIDRGDVIEQRRTGGRAVVARLLDPVNPGRYHAVLAQHESDGWGVYVLWGAALEEEPSQDDLELFELWGRFIVVGRLAEFLDVPRARVREHLTPGSVDVLYPGFAR